MKHLLHFLAGVVCCGMLAACTTEEQTLLSRPGDHVYYSFTGSFVSISMEGIAVNEDENCWICVSIDGGEPMHLEVKRGEQTVSLTSTLSEGEHKMEVTKATERHTGKVKINGLVVNEGETCKRITPSGKKHIHYIGDSTTCGYGVDAANQDEHFSPETENFCHTYCYLTAKALDAEWSVEATSGIGLVVNGPYTPDDMPTMTESYPYEDFAPDYICINVGVNDIGNPKHDRGKWVESYRIFLTKLHEKYPKAELICMCGPMFPLREEGEQTDDEKHAEMIEEAIGGLYIPEAHFLMLKSREDVGFGADWHPSVGQHKYAAEQLEAFIKELQ